MRITVWVTEGTWPACVDAARELAAQDTEYTLIHVLDTGPQEMAATASSGLLGRGRRRDPAQVIGRLGEEAAEDMLRQAAARLQTPARIRLESGRPERVVTAAAEAADYLVVGRDGDRSRLGPHGLGRHTRFVVDHAPCRVLLIWPEPAPDLGSIPPPPPHP